LITENIKLNIRVSLETSKSAITQHIADGVSLTNYKSFYFDCFAEMERGEALAKKQWGQVLKL